MRAIAIARMALAEALGKQPYAAALDSAFYSATVRSFLLYLAAEAHLPTLLRQEAKAQAVLLREIFGNPFRPLPPMQFPASVRGVAGSVYQSQDQADYLILADALEDSGCLEQHLDASWIDQGTGLYLPVLHLRQPECPHVKGCHVVDWILGR